MYSIAISTAAFTLSRRHHVKPSVSTLRESIPAINSSSMNLYEILRVEKKASLIEIKTAYRSLAKLYHPDTPHDGRESDDRVFIEINKAYETLSDPEARALYDLKLGGKDRLRAVGYLGLGHFPTRRWESDQCW